MLLVTANGWPLSCGRALCYHATHRAPRFARLKPAAVSFSGLLAGKRRKSAGLREPSDDVEPIRGCVWCKKVRDGALCPPWSTKKLNGPLRMSLLAHVLELTWCGLIDVLALKDQRDWIIRSRRGAGELERLRIGCERVEVIVPFLHIRRASGRAAPDPVFEYFVPDVTASCPGKRRVGTDRLWVENIRELGIAHSCRLTC